MYDSENSVYIHGWKDNPVEDIVLDNVTVTIDKKTDWAGGWYDPRPGTVFKTSGPRALEMFSQYLFGEMEDGMALEEPFKGLETQATDPLSLLLPIEGANAEPCVRIKGTTINPVPYYMAGSKTTGTRTYFEI